MFNSIYLQNGSLDFIYRTLNLLIYNCRRLFIDNIINRVAFIGNLVSRMFQKLFQKMIFIEIQTQFFSDTTDST